MQPLEEVSDSIVAGKYDPAESLSHQMRDQVCDERDGRSTARGGEIADFDDL